jgi:hypothetical protein
MWIFPTIGILCQPDAEEDSVETGGSVLTFQDYLFQSLDF